MQERGDDHETQQGDDLDPGVETLEQSTRTSNVLGEHRSAYEVRRPAQRLGDDASLAVLADATARAESDLTPQEPIGCEAGFRSGGRTHTLTDSVASSVSEEASSRRRRSTLTNRKVPKMTPAISSVPSAAET